MGTGLCACVSKNVQHAHTSNQDTSRIVHDQFQFKCAEQNLSTDRGVVKLTQMMCHVPNPRNPIRFCRQPPLAKLFSISMVSMAMANVICYS